MRKPIAVFIISLLLGGCSKQQESLAQTADAPGPRSAQEVSKVVAGDMASPGSPVVTPMIVRRADVRIVVDDTSKAVDAVTRSIESAGGYVAGSRVWRDGELLRAKLTLRVPAKSLTPALASIRGLAKRVEDETITSDDVSQEFVDLESRVRNLEATEIELRELLKTARINSKKATDVLEVHQQVMAVRGEIEQARGRMRYLSQVTALSSIDLEVVPDAIAQPVVEPGWQPLVIVKNAGRALVGVLQTMATAGIWLVVYVVPVFGMLVLFVAGLWKIIPRRRKETA